MFTNISFLLLLIFSSNYLVVIDCLGSRNKASLLVDVAAGAGGEESAW